MVNHFGLLAHERAEIHEVAGRSSSLASMTPEVQIAKQSSSPSILETKSKRFALVAASANSWMRS